MKKKGFTLIELLAVIIILAVIALIATPIVLNVIENTKKKAFEQSAVGYYNAARYVYDEMYLKNDRQDVLFSFENGELKSSNKEYNLGVGGEIPKGGLVHLSSNGDVSVAIHNNKYCAIVDEKGNTTLSENLSECGVIPTECFIVDDVGLIEDDLKIIQEYNLLGKIGLQDKIHSIVGIDTGNEICANLKNVIFPSEIDGQAIEMIGVGDSEYEGFSGSYNNIILENGIKYIDYFGAQGLETNNFYMPDSVKGISGSVFHDSSALCVENNIKLSDNLLYIGIQNFTTHMNGYSHLNLQNIVYVGDMCFTNGNISELILGPNLKYIGNQAFNNNQLSDAQAFIYARNADGTEDKTTIISYGGANRDNVIIPDGVITVGQLAFAHNRIQNIIMPDTVVTIGFQAFYGNRLQSIIIPSNVISIEHIAFSDNLFKDASDIIIKGDAARFDSIWASIGFPAK